MVKGYKRGDSYSFELKKGLTRIGKVVRSNRSYIVVVYKAEKNIRTRTIKKGDLECQKKNKK